MYGEAKVVPTPETEPAAPVSGYGMSKNTAERYARWFGEHHGLDVVTLRYGNVYGPRQDGTQDTGVIAITCYRLLERAMREGAPFDPLWHADPEFQSLRDFVPFQTLIAPKG